MAILHVLHQLIRCQRRRRYPILHFHPLPLSTKCERKKNFVEVESGLTCINKFMNSTRVFRCRHSGIIFFFLVRKVKNKKKYVYGMAYERRKKISEKKILRTLTMKVRKRKETEKMRSYLNKFHKI